MANLYNLVMPNGWPARSGPLFKGLNTDDIYGGAINDNVGTIQVANHPWAGSFPSQYKSIRQINILLQEIQSGSLDSTTRNQIVGQALFLRAFSYFLLVRVYGGVPLLLKPQALTDSLQVTRASTADVFNSIMADLDKSIQLLQGQPFVNGDKGRIGLAAALAFKGRVALYKASPLFNPSNPYTNTYWQEAYNANLTAKTQLDAMGFGLNPSYSGIWDVNNKGNKECILTVTFKVPDKTDGRYEQGARPLSQSSNAAGIDNPLWSLVQAYPMQDGYAPGTSPNYSYNDQTFWLNRDPRFYASIVNNGSIYECGGIPGRRQYTDDILASPLDAYTTNPASYCFTGLYTRKGMQPQLPAAQSNQNSVDWIEIRYAEVLLNLAEAANETGHSADAIALLQQIRQRAGINAGNGNYGITATSQTDVRNAIYNERLIEFSFEGQRFWDLKRSRTLTNLNGFVEMGVASTLKSSNLPVDQTKASNYSYLPEDFVYSFGPLIRQTASNITFSIPNKYYFAPIPLAQIQTNPNLAQNVDWGGTFNPTLE
ncbi:MAG: RagB/SusD family nutrient uptake outer membrane protein [Bacteroidetes bacterium]|nr:RagB/SusD family nutrient uptake outer membrane protein [Bacteroidota bacterium]